MGGIDRNDRILGGVTGVVVGDALGLPVQFETRAEVRAHPIAGMRGHGTFDLPAGSWSDDGSMTLCTALALTERGFDPSALADRFVRWYRDGEVTPFGHAFDIGNATDTAMRALERGTPPLSAGPKNEYSNGNGSLMRILPVAAYGADLPVGDLVRLVADASRLTHGHPRSQLGCVLYALVVRELLAGATPEAACRALCDSAAAAVAGSGLEPELPAYRRVLDGGLAALPEAEISGSGYVVHTLEAALWALLTTDGFEAALLRAVNLGEDTDTVGAVCGGLAGVRYGLSGIPADWRAALVRGAEVHAWAKAFAAAVPTGSTGTSAP
jgi:ADP-ribosyl-[dinitrogen reductase] hydrolase